MKRLAGLVVCVACFLTAAASADSGYVAHPDLAGTQTLTVAALGRELRHARGSRDAARA